LCNDHGIFSDHDVVRNLYKIVDLHALLDPCPAKPRAIDSCVRAELDVVIDLDNPELRNFLVAAIDHFETKAFSSDYSAAVNDYARANATPLANCHMRINVTRGPDDCLASDVTACPNDCIVADLCAGFDDHQRLNRNALAQLSACIDNSAMMNASRE